MACNAYMADITEPRHRTKRVAFMTGCYWIGFNSGKAIGGIIKEELGFMYNFALGMLASVLTSVYAAVFLKDSTHIREERLHQEASVANKTDGSITHNKNQTIVLSEATNIDKFKKLFSLQNIQDGVR